jgi:hypothetical protein
MIELDILTYLKADSTLDTLLVSSASDSKIYPDQVAHGKSMSDPYIIYSIASDLRVNEVLQEVTINFNCTSDNHLEARSIRDRLIELLDHDDRIQSLISSSDYFIYSAQLRGGASFVDNSIGEYHYVAVFTFLYGRGGYTVPSSTVVPVDGLNKIVSFVYQGTLVDETYVREKFYFQRSVTIYKVGGYIQEAPVGASIIVDLIKNDVEQSRLFIIPAGATAPTAPIVLTSIVYTPTDKLDIKIKQIGSTTPGAGLQVDLYYR